MYPFHLEEIARQLIADKVVKPDQYEAALKSLETYWSDKVAVTWCVEDVQDRYPKLKLSEKQARDILSMAFRQSTADRGLTWDTIHDAARYLDYKVDDAVEEDDGGTNTP
jgi:hypothetical protein